MKNRIKLLLVCLVCLAVNCKYEDGPLISFVSLVHRIEGRYHVESATQNGDDQMEIINELKIDNLFFNWVEDDNSSPVPYGTLSVSFKDTTLSYGTFWTLESNNEEIKIYVFGCTGGTNPVQSYPVPGFLNDGICEGLYWKILRLTDNELCLSISFDSDDYEVQLKEE